MTVEIRPALPNAEDATAFAELANMAAHDLIAEMVGKNYRQVLAQMFFRSDNLYSHRFAHFAAINGNIAGLIFAFYSGQRTAMVGMTDQLFMRYVGLGLPRSFLVRMRIQPLLSFMSTIPSEAFYLQAIALYPQFRGQGISKVLLAKSDELAHLEGSLTLELDVESDNKVAINAYQGHGMSITASSPTIFFQNQKRHIALHRMVKRLM